MNNSDLIGKTISNVQQMKSKSFDDEGFLRLEFTDGTSRLIIASYSGYTGNSLDEYPTSIYVDEDDWDLVPID